MKRATGQGVQIAERIDALGNFESDPWFGGKEEVEEALRKIKENVGNIGNISKLLKEHLQEQFPRFTLEMIVAGDYGKHKFLALAPLLLVSQEKKKRRN